MKMSLTDWVNNNWLRQHTSSRQEITDLLNIVERDVKDAGNTSLSSDWQFGIAYNAALKLCKILLHASGYRTETKDNHYRTISSLPLILGSAVSDYADYLNSCRIKRNTVEYDMAGAATLADAEELLEFIGEMKQEVIKWLEINHPEFV
jgi:uncharacterized protein (UPF0332 family)